MKKIVYFWVATFLMLFATSCQKEVGGDNATVSFNIGTPKIATRAFSDGTTATVLQYAVYDAEGNELTDFTVTDGVIHGSTVVNFNLVTGNTYSVIFWAAAENAPYAIDFEQKTMTVDYENASCNDERRDAFYAYHTFTVTGAQTETIELKRPFAQINIGTNDYAAAKAAGYEPTKSSVKVNSVFTTFNFVDGTVSGDTTVTYDYADIVKDSFPVVGYEYLAMNYVLVAAEKTVVDVEFAHTAVDASTAKTRTVGSVPVQRNYRTNIYGKLLTSDVEINVVIVPEYEEEEYGIEDGAEAPVAVSTKEELVELFMTGGSAILTDDIEFEKIVAIEPGAEVYLNLNGKTITVDQNTTSNTLLYVKEGSKLIIDGNGTINLEGVSTMAIFAPYGELVIENGTFIRNEVETVTNKTTGLFMGAKTTGSNVTINGGYFDAGYYNIDAADIEEILAGTKELEETADDIAKRGNSKDANKVRVALKENVSILLNHSGYGSFKIYGGTFVGANPAWGDEGCMLPTTPNYLRPWSYYQGALLDGQEFNENGIVLPIGYAITKDTLDDGRPTYTVTYNK